MRKMDTLFCVLYALRNALARPGEPHSSHAFHPNQIMASSSGSASEARTRAPREKSAHDPHAVLPRLMRCERTNAGSAEEQEPLFLSHGRQAIVTHCLHGSLILSVCSTASKRSDKGRWISDSQRGKRGNCVSHARCRTGAAEAPKAKRGTAACLLLLSQGDGRQRLRPPTWDSGGRPRNDTLQQQGFRRTGPTKALRRRCVAREPAGSCVNREQCDTIKAGALAWHRYRRQAAPPRTARRGTRV
jgi:hypothetical protein